ncbi:DUF2642 domain-containing protein [Lentibacillus sp. CBA3610]|uniref:DUF2642 domain-containing protein n=1 Tax=Lentibacillus sp. CBA3610 TaxID=2518176 RepID=UPI00159619FE|nr:DUF2642 domain-containing protein [Lentibacillus sp. CBA3610]QKY71112.1 DUF2642 domain-containing protein [Lentibacillus sp. CBA3610]
MPNLTNRQQNLLQLANQLSQNLVNNNTGTANNVGLNKNVSLDLPGIDFDAGLNLGLGSDDRTGAPADPPPTTPTTLRDVLLGLVNEQVEVTTPFGPVTGTLIAVRDDYVVLVETDGAQALVPFENIELVSEL